MDGFTRNNQISEINETRLVELLERITSELIFYWFGKFFNREEVMLNFVRNGLKVGLNYKIKKDLVLCFTDPFVFHLDTFRMSFILDTQDVRMCMVSEMVFRKSPERLVKSFRLELVL